MLAIMPLLTVSAQQYTVYSVAGDAFVKEQGRDVSLKPRKAISTATVLRIGKESAVTVLDERNSRMYSFTEAGTKTVGQLIAGKKSSAKNLSKQYMGYLVKQLFASGSKQMSHPDTYMQSTATAYRSVAADSLMLRRVAAALAGSAPGGPSLETAFAASGAQVDTDLDVSFELVSCDTGEPLGQSVPGNTGCYVRVRNGTDDLVYVNVLNVDAAGNKYLVLPVDSASSCAHLLVPPMSTVAFKSEPMIFGDTASEESFLLVATEEPVDFSILMSPIKASEGSRMRTGLYRRRFSVGQ